MEEKGEILIFADRLHAHKPIDHATGEESEECQFHLA